MRSKNWLRDALEETSYKIFLEQNPKFVELIKSGLLAGEPAEKIKKFIKQSAGKDHQLTSNLIGHMVDYVEKQIKN